LTTKKNLKHPKEIEAKRYKTIKERQDADVKKIKQKMADPNLLLDTVKEIQQSGVAGEEDTILAQIIVTSSRLVKMLYQKAQTFYYQIKQGLEKTMLLRRH